MEKDKLKYKVLFFPDKELATEKTEKTFIVVDEKTGKETAYNYDAKLRVRIRWSEDVLNFNIGERVELAKWEKGTQRCTKNTTHGKNKRAAKEINKIIDDTETKIDDLFTKFQEKNIIPTVDQFRSHYTTNGQTIKEKTFIDYFDEFVSTQSNENNWKPSTHVKLSAIRNHYEAFAGTYKKGINFNTFDKVGLNAFVNYLRDKKGMRNSTILKQVDILKWFLKWAATNGYNQNMSYQSFSPNLTTTKNKVIFLNWAELMHVYNFNFATATHKDINGNINSLEPDTATALEKVRDVFCFCCFTSLRYSDVANLKRANISGDEITITTIKTDDTLTIELNDYSRAILAKYNDHVFIDGRALPVISNQKMNDRLKEMGEVCGLNTPITETYYKGATRYDDVYQKWELLSTHCGRRTFICNALTLGIAPTTVMQWTGHTNYETMKPYIGVANDEKKKAMNLFNR